MSPRRQGRSIGAVLAQLQPEFPTLTISKIRFLEAEGLLTPERSESGYRTYAVADVERLRYILTAQRDRFWPLKVIRDALDALERGLTSSDATPGVPTVPQPDSSVDLAGIPAAEDFVSAGSLRLTAAELQQAAALPADHRATLESFGLLRPDAQGYYGEAELAVARAAAALTAYGIEARHLRPFRSAAEREVSLVDQALGPATAGMPAGDRDARAGEMLHLCLALHAALVRAEYGR